MLYFSLDKFQKPKSQIQILNLHFSKAKIQNQKRKIPNGIKMTNGMNKKKLYNSMFLFFQTATPMPIVRALAARPV